MGNYIRIIGVVIIWGLLSWGNLSLALWTNNDYQERMDNNYLINSYEGKLLLSQEEYKIFKQYLVSPDVTIHNLDTYSSDDILISYWITAPDNYKPPFIESPTRQHSRYDVGQGSDYFLRGIVIFFSIIIGVWLTGLLYHNN